MGTVEDKLNKALSTKAAIKAALIAQGQEVSDTDTFASYAGKVQAIRTGVDTSDATATAADILVGKTAYAKGEKLTGTADLCTVTLLAKNQVGLAEAGGSATGGGMVQKDMTIQVSAAAEEWNKFAGWESEEGYVFSYENPLSVTVDRDRTLTAAFVETPHFTMTVLADPPEGGTVSGGGKYSMDQSVTITATPKEGYLFRYWMNEQGQQMSSRNPFTVPSQYFMNNGGKLTYIAKFEPIPEE